MLTTQELLLRQTADAFSGRPDMSLMAALKDLTDDEAQWTPDGDTFPSIEQLVRHTAWAKSTYCHEGFGTAMAIHDPTCNETGDSLGLSVDFPCGAGWGRDDAPGIEGAIKLLRDAHAVLVRCLEACSQEALARDIPTRHGKPAARLFSVLAMHDAYHAGQIRTRRTMWRRTKR